ncbi:hypothetical protein ACX0G7_09570 [Flavitalea antarctica]
MEFNKDVEKKNPIFYSVLAFVLGIAGTIAGWQMWESTIKSHADAAGFILFPGLILLAAGAIAMFAFGYKRKKS